jgi:LPS export ABC transporter protein LptC
VRPLALALPALLALGGCHHHHEQASEQPTQTLEGVEMSQSTLGKPAWSLKAAAATLENGDAVALLEKPEVRFFKDKKQVSTVSADSGVIETDTHDVTLSTNVVVHSVEDRTTLKTSQLVYSSAKKKFLTDREVEVNRPGGSLHGKGLEASPDLTDIRIFNQRTVLEKVPE